MSAADEAKLRSNIVREARYLIIDATYTGRGHQQEAQRWEKWRDRLGVPATMVSAILGLGAAGSALTGGKWIAAILAVASVAITAVNEYLRPGERVEAHHVKGNRYISVRNETRLLLRLDIHAGLSSPELVQRLKDLRERYNALNEALPGVPDEAYRGAKRSIDAGESSYENDPLWKELDD